MLSEIFKAILITSLAGSLLAVVITLLKPVTKRIFGYSWHYYIWLAVLFVMIMPVRFSLPQNSAVIPVVNTQTVQTDQITETAPTNIADAGQNVNMANTITTAQKATDFINMIINNRMNYLSAIWLLGIAVMLMINISGYIRLIIRIHKNSVVVSCPRALNYTDKKITVRKGRDLSSPFMLGVFRPTLVLPDKDLSAEQLDNILRHEMTHFCRRDILYKWFTLIVRSVHWFNPVVYYVARQINNECEISCDLSVVSSMNSNEQISYVNTILSLVSGDRVKRIPLTTQMASGKRVLKRRFTMIKNVKKTSKFMSVVSAVIAVVMLGTTVFASGVLSGLNEDSYTVMFSNNAFDDKEFEFQNKAFVENDEVYMPLRELFYIVGAVSDDDDGSYIKWDNGKIDLCVTQFDDMEVVDETDTIVILYTYQIEIGKSALIENSESNLAGQDFSNSRAMTNAPILKNGVTYIPYSYVDYMLNSPSSGYWNVNYSIYDKDGSLISSSFGPLSDQEARAAIENYEDKTEKCYEITDKFFAAFENGDMNTMKQYGTDRFVKYYFSNDKFLSMKQAKLGTIYSIRIFTDGKYYVHLRIKSDDLPNDNNIFYAIFEEQPDGEFLLYDFQESYKDEWEL